MAASPGPLHYVLLGAKHQFWGAHEQEGQVLSLGWEGSGARREFLPSSTSLHAPTGFSAQKQRLNKDVTSLIERQV